MGALAWLLNLGFAGGGEEVAPEPPASTTGAGSSTRRRRYPRRVSYRGRVQAVRNAEEERAFLAWLREQAMQDARTVEVLGDIESAAAIRANAVRIAKRIDRVADRQSQWLEQLRAEDDEILLALA